MTCRLLHVFVFLAVAGLAVAGLAVKAIAQSPIPLEQRSWVVRNQAKDGSFSGVDGKPSLEETSLIALALIGEGNQLAKGTYAPQLRRAMRWLVAQQKPDGTVEADGPGCTRRLGLIAYTLVEAVGRSEEKGPMRAAAELALKAMFARRYADGGFGDPKASSDALSTYWCVVSAASAEAFRLKVAVPAAKLVEWFDGHSGVTGEQVGCELLARFMVGQDPGKSPMMFKLAGVLVTKANPAMPVESYLTTYALFSLGGQHWRTWKKKLERTLVRTQLREGKDHGAWPPAGSLSRAATTAFGYLTLQGYYRYPGLLPK